MSNQDVIDKINEKLLILENNLLQRSIALMKRDPMYQSFLGHILAYKDILGLSDDRESVFNPLTGKREPIDP